MSEKPITNKKARTASIVLALLFTLALVFITLEAPRIINRILLDVSPDHGNEEWQEAIAAFENLKPFGYAAFAITIFLIILGFVLKKGWVSALGSIALYLPTFGYFAMTMFLLAGIGIIRISWAPLLGFPEQSNLLRLGDIVVLPWLLIQQIAKSVPWELHSLTMVLAIMVWGISFIIIAAGLFVFSSGAVAWLYGKYKGAEIIDFWIYKHSRHPQYLGFLLWSYGS